MKLICMIRWLFMVVAMAAAYTCSAFDEPAYKAHRYKLVKSNSPEFCQHMGLVYRKNFKHPWHQEDKKGAVGARYFGRLPHELFKASEGVVQTPSDSFDLLLNMVPSSPEFDAVPWVEARQILEWYPSMGKGFGVELLPMLVAEIDVDNDGKNEYFVKRGFLRSVPRNGLSDWGAAPKDFIEVYDRDSIRAIDFSRFDRRKYKANEELTGFFETDNVTTLIRPLRYAGKWYFHAYHTKWPEVETAHGLPSKESIEIFQIDRGGAEGAPRRMSMCVFDVSTMNKHGRR